MVSAALALSLSSFAFISVLVCFSFRARSLLSVPSVLPSVLTRQPQPPAPLPLAHGWTSKPGSLRSVMLRRSGLAAAGLRASGRQPQFQGDCVLAHVDRSCFSRLPPTGSPGAHTAPGSHLQNTRLLCRKECWERVPLPAWTLSGPIVLGLLAPWPPGLLACMPLPPSPSSCHSFC